MEVGSRFSSCVGIESSEACRKEKDDDASSSTSKPQTGTQSEPRDKLKVSPGTNRSGLGVANSQNGADCTIQKFLTNLCKC